MIHSNLEKRQSKRFSASVAALFIVFVLSMFFISRSTTGSTDPADAPVLMMEGYVERIGCYLTGNKNCDLVVLGSSLVLVPNLLADGYYQNLPIPIGQSLDYVEYAIRHFRLAHLEHLLLEHGVKVSSANLGSPAAMVEDYNLIFEKLCCFGKCPKFLVIAVAPRDFLDNTIPPGHSAISHSLKRYATMAEIFGLDHLKARGKCLSSLVSAWFEWFRTALIKSVRSSFSSRERRLSISACSKEQSDSSRKNFEQAFYLGENSLSNLDDYRHRYLPVDGKRFAVQLMAMNELLNNAKNHGVRVVVVDMPLTAENQQLLSESVWSAYRSSLRDVCTQNRAELLSATKMDDYEKGDFLDSCHLNAKGAHKCLNAIASVVARLN